MSEYPDSPKGLPESITNKGLNDNAVLPNNTKKESIKDKAVLLVIFLKNPNRKILKKYMDPTRNRKRPIKGKGFAKDPTIELNVDCNVFCPNTGTSLHTSMKLDIHAYLTECRLPKNPNGL